MPKVAHEVEFEVQEDFEADLTFTAEEFNERENAPDQALDAKVNGRRFSVDRDCMVNIRGVTVELKAGKKITDIGLGFSSLAQGADVSVTESLSFQKGSVITNESVARALLDMDAPLKENKKPKLKKQKDSE